MNLILLHDRDIGSSGQAVISNPHQIAHIRRVLRASVGDTLRIGRLNGLMGRGVVRQINDGGVLLDTLLDTPPPEPLPLTLILGLPRPKMLGRTLQYIASAGVKRLVLLHSTRVEKSYWQTASLAEDAIRQQLLLGLEQGCDTRLPEVTLAKNFQHFVDEDLPALAGDSLKLVAHPYTPNPCPAQVKQSVTLAVGPEGGFIEPEVAALTDCGFQPVHLGQRIIRVEPVIPFLLGRLF